METYSHQMLPHSHAVLNPQLRMATCFTEFALSSDFANTAIAKICSHHSAWPCKMPKTGISALKGHAKLTDCAQPAINNTTNCIDLLCHMLGHDLEPLHRTAFGVQHREAQAVQHHAFTALGDVAHFVGDQAAYGVELVV
jgi:hypothetical protein